jgi:hypothetical protein
MRLVAAQRITWDLHYMKHMLVILFILIPESDENMLKFDDLNLFSEI